MANDLSEETIREIIRSEYGLNTTALERLPGYDDINYKVTVDSAEPKAFVFKATQRDSLEELDLQNAVMRHLKTKNFPVPKIVSSKTGLNVFERKGWRMRLLSYIEGKTLQNNRSPNLLYELGKITAQMDRELQNIAHPSGNRFLLWDLKNASEIRKYTHLLDNEEKEIVTAILKMFEKQKNQLTQTRQSIIHNDINDVNILTDGHNIVGIIDFGDVVQSNLVNNVAIGLTHLMQDNNDTLDVVKPFLHGYCYTLQLTEKERQLLPTLILTRLATLLTFSKYFQTQDQKNERIARVMGHAKSLLKRLSHLNDEEILKKLD